MNNTLENITSLNKVNDSSILKEMKEPLNSTDNAIRLVNHRNLREEKNVNKEEDNNMKFSKDLFNKNNKKNNQQIKKDIIERPQTAQVRR